MENRERFERRLVFAAAAFFVITVLFIVVRRVHPWVDLVFGPVIRLLFGASSSNPLASPTPASAAATGAPQSAALPPVVPRQQPSLMGTLNLPTFPTPINVSAHGVPGATDPSPEARGYARVHGAVPPVPPASFPSLSPPPPLPSRPTPPAEAEAEPRGVHNEATSGVAAPDPAEPAPPTDHDAHGGDGEGEGGEGGGYGEEEEGWVQEGEGDGGEEAGEDGHEGVGDGEGQSGAETAAERTGQEPLAAQAQAQAQAQASPSARATAAAQSQTETARRKDEL